MGKLLQLLEAIVRREQAIADAAVVTADAAVDRATNTDRLLESAQRRRANYAWDETIERLGSQLNGDK